MGSKRGMFLSALARSIEGGAAPCPMCGKGNLRLRYVADPMSRVGYLDAWCDNCFKGVHVSRASVPDGMRFTPFGDCGEGDVPNCTTVN
ncbi:hypothetical protein FHR83_003625 [Actinoplanes campanulatus]|uniref:Uncharacterized protein n=1 Tax=Actinoplanes campanulatus TaxID=113559 RepID=A0A7W5AH24_9ACTN|nr:hypothetical protein [Actinoplanes campanulatus]